MSKTNDSKKFYAEGVERMYNEGIEYVSKIKDYINQHKERLSKLERAQRKKAISDECENFRTFIQVHPIVFEYLVTEDVFDERAFKGYIKAAFGAPKSSADQELIARDKRNVYYLKNKQYALYYKYLVKESNPDAPIHVVNQAYDEMVQELDRSTKEMLDQYEESQKALEIKDKQLTEDKKNELIDLLKSRLRINANDS